MAELTLSVLDQSASTEAGGEAAAIRDTLELAVHCESLGYRRFWVSEHHGLPTIVGTAPEILMAAIAARTSTIRIGSAGVMLPHYSAFKVAEQFRVLDALAPGRIDLGVGRAPGSDMRTARLLNSNASHAAEDFHEQIRDLHAWLALPSHRGVVAHPRGDGVPAIWVLGSSDYGAQLAAHYGLPYAFAYFFTDGQGAEQAMALYRALFKPGEILAAPQATLCVWALVAGTDDEARLLARSRDRWRLDRAKGVFGPLQPPERIAFTAAEEAELAPMHAKAFVGSPATVGAKLRALAERFQLDEIVVNTWAHEPAVRRTSYALLAEEFGLVA